MYFFLIQHHQFGNVWLMCSIQRVDTKLLTFYKSSFQFQMQMQLGACSHVLKLKLMFLNAMIYFQRAGEAAWPGLAVLSLGGTGSIWLSTSAVWWKRGWRSWRSWLWCEAWETAQAAEKRTRRSRDFCSWTCPHSAQAWSSFTAASLQASCTVARCSSSSTSASMSLCCLMAPGLSEDIPCHVWLYFF